MLTEKDEIANRWTDYFKSIFNRENRKDKEIEKKTSIKGSQDEEAERDNNDP